MYIALKEDIPKTLNRPTLSGAIPVYYPSQHPGGGAKRYSAMTQKSRMNCQDPSRGMHKQAVKLDWQNLPPPVEQPGEEPAYQPLEVPPKGGLYQKLDEARVSTESKKIPVPVEPATNPSNVATATIPRPQRSTKKVELTHQIPTGDWTKRRVQSPPDASAKWFPMAQGPDGIVRKGKQEDNPVIIDMWRKIQETPKRFDFPRKSFLEDWATRQTLNPNPGWATRVVNTQANAQESSEDVSEDESEDGQFHIFMQKRLLKRKFIQLKRDCKRGYPYDPDDADAWKDAEDLIMSHGYKDPKEAAMVAMGANSQKQKAPTADSEFSLESSFESVTFEEEEEDSSDYGTSVESRYNQGYQAVVLARAATLIDESRKAGNLHVKANAHILAH